MNAPTIPILKKYNILKIDDCIDLEISKLAYKLSNKTLPSPILTLFNFGAEYHEYNTRNRNNPTVAKHKSAIFNKSFLCKCPTSWRILNDDTKNSKSIKSFTRKIKKEKFKLYI